MGRLIDADKLIKEMEGWLSQDKYYYPDEESREIPYDEAVYYINNLPTVDAIPVKHGHWIGSEFNGFDRCSNCNAIWDVSLTKRNRFFRHCPRCGALMDDVFAL